MRYLRLKLLILTLFGFIMISCFSRNTHAVPEGAVIRYAENGTPFYIKGKNLSSNLDNDLRFCMLKKEGRYGEIVYQFLLSLDKLLKIDDPYREFEIAGVKTDSLESKHIKLQQVHNGIAVWGRSISVHLNQDNHVYLFQGHYEPTLRNVDITPNLSEKEAAKRAISEATGGEGGCRVQENKLFIFMVGDQTPRLAYRITLVQGLMRREYYFVDAMNGKILHKLSGTPKGDSLSLPR
jgi:Zn-dependent metalloprotease